MAQAVKDNGVETIAASRSQAIPLALLEAPYRTFCQNSPSVDKTSPQKKNLMIYCKPTSVSEYLASSSESSTVRSGILSDASTTVTAIYDVSTDSILGGDGAAVLDAISGKDDAQATLAESALLALADLDKLAAEQAIGPKSRKDVVIVVGSGGREHALAVAVAKSPLVAQVICCPGNGGTAVEGGKISNAEGVNGKQDNATVIELVKKTNAKMVVIGPEAPLVAGLVDEMATACPGVLAFGPSKAGAELEASKVRRAMVAIIYHQNWQKRNTNRKADNFFSLFFFERHSQKTFCKSTAFQQQNTGILPMLPKRLPMLNLSMNQTDR